MTVDSLKKFKKMTLTSKLRLVFLTLGLAFLYAPIVSLIVYSFNASKLMTVWGGFSVKWYFALFADKQMMDAVLTSLIISFSSACMSVVIGTLAAIVLARITKFRGESFFALFITAPMVLPEVIIGLSMLLMFVTLSDLIGWPAQRGMLTIWIAMVTVTAAYVTVVVRSRLRELDTSIEEAALCLMGALIMTHSDDNGLVLPPKLAPIQVVIVPIYKKEEQLKEISDKVAGIVNGLKKLGVSVKYDDADNKRPGFKFADYELKGVPVRLVLGARDLENNTVELMRRDTLEKTSVSLDGIEEHVKNLLDKIQDNLYQKARNFRINNTRTVETYDEFKEEIEKGGFLLAHWDGTTETEERIKEETKATIRCIPLEGDQIPGKCMVTDKPSKQRVIFARSY